MRLIAASLIATAALTGCTTTIERTVVQTIVEPRPAPEAVEEALAFYYDTIPDEALPHAPAGLPLPDEDTVLTRILVASCNDEEKESRSLASVAEEEADLFLMIGDNVYGDRDGGSYANNQPELDELRESFSDLAARPEFQAVRAAHPMMAVWDDHDYGANDGGRDFPFREFSERIHETFWGLTDEDVGKWPGTYYARSFGPQGRRIQIIMLDTRSFRSLLTPTDQWNAPGKERYMPAPEGSMQDMLGAAQWTWLENQLQQPADLRLIISSIQVLTTDGHGYEHWNNLPAERDRLMELIASTNARGVVFLSGDRHAAFMYRREDVLDYPVHELTASSLNLSFASETDEMDTNQINEGVAAENFGAVGIDWESREVTLEILSNEGEMLRETSFPIPR